MAYFDLRFALGWLFLIVGGLLISAGFVVQPLRPRSRDRHEYQYRVGSTFCCFSSQFVDAAWNRPANSRRRRKIEVSANYLRREQLERDPQLRPPSRARINVLVS